MHSTIKLTFGMQLVKPRSRWEILHGVRTLPFAPLVVGPSMFDIIDHPLSPRRPCFHICHLCITVPTLPPF